jgi:hypothetical protein
MKLNTPFEISARLAPALRIADSNGTAWLSYDRGQFVIDLPDGSEHIVTGFNPPQMRVQGANPLQDDFVAILSFLSACAESRSYAERRGLDAAEGDNSSLFPENVGEWAQQMSDEISMLQMEIETAESSLIED